MKKDPQNIYQSKPNWIREDYVTDYYTFLKSIDWTEWWLVSVLIFHSACFLIILLTTRYQVFQFGMFFSLLAVVYFAENINALGADNWKLFSNEQYFDSSGLFISTILSVPVLINCTILIVIWLYSAGTMLIKTKRAQISDATKEVSKVSKESPIEEKMKKNK